MRALNSCNFSLISASIATASVSFEEYDPYACIAQHNERPDNAQRHKPVPVPGIERSHVGPGNLVGNKGRLQECGLGLNLTINMHDG